MPRDGTEIGPLGTKVRRKQAREGASPSLCAPASAPISQGETPERKRRARTRTIPRKDSPDVSPIGQASNGEAGGDGQRRRDTHTPPAISAIVDKLVMLQRQRRLCITDKNSSERRIDSLIAMVMGFRLDSTEKERKAVFAAAKAHRLAVEKGGEGHQEPDAHHRDALSAITKAIVTSAGARAPWIDLRAQVENDMEQLAGALPATVVAFARLVAGFGKTTLIPLAGLVGEAGIPIGDYRTPSGLWKRFGVAVIDGRRQRKVTGKRKDKEEAKKLAYSAERRALLWSICSDTMLRAQWTGDRDEDGGKPMDTKKPIAVPAHATGPYGEMYGRRKEHMLPRIAATAYLPDKDPEKWTAKRCDNDARRFMSKALLVDLWRVWNGMPPRWAEPGDAQ